MSKTMMGGKVPSGNQEPVTIEVDKLSDKPTKCWEVYQVKQTVNTVETLPLDTPVYPDKVRFVCVSDTHGKDGRWDWDHKIPDGDVFLHAGDFTNIGEYNQICQFDAMLASLPHTHKIVIAGNHDITMEPWGVDGRRYELETRWGMDTSQFSRFLRGANIKHPKELLTSCTYLEDSETTVFGIKVYGSPWQPYFGGWGFNKDRGEDILKVWNKIPNDVDVLMTHGPPLGHGDLCRSELRAGCVELLNTIQKRVKPKYHIFGHIHEAYGVTSDGHTTFINASICNYFYKPGNPPVIFDIPLPPGVSKQDFPVPVVKPRPLTSLEKLIAETKKDLERIEREKAEKERIETEAKKGNE